MGNVRHFVQHHETRIKVYYQGSDTLQRGYALCYDQDATENSSDKTDRLGYTVEKPATANLNVFAGVVADGPVTGPCEVEIVVPTKWNWCEVFTDANMTAATTALAPQNNSYALAAHSDSGLNLPAVALAGVTEDTDTTNALSTVRWL